MPSITCVDWNANFAVHMPPTHTLPCGQGMLQAPQLLRSEPRFTSQPFAALLSQSPQPARHESSVHWLFTHAVFALGMLHCGQVQPPFVQTSPCGHTLPHLPQLFTS